MTWDETVCLACNEINILKTPAEMAIRSCDDCQRTGTLMLISEYNKLPVGDLSKVRGQARAVLRPK